jgi:F-type H+-transporting ATPase subunit b
MKIDWSTLVLQTVNALILLWLLARFLFRPVAKIIEERQASARALLGDACAAKLAAQAERDALTAERAQLAAQRTQTLAQVEADAEKQRASLLAAAREAVDRLHAQTAMDIAHDRAAQAEAASALATQLAVDIAGKLLDRLPESMRVTGFIDGLSEGLRSLSPGARSDMASDATLQLTAPRALTSGEQAECEAAFSDALAHRVTFETRVDGSLIAGLELSGAHGVVRNSWRDQLQQIHTGLLRDDGHAH